MAESLSNNTITFRAELARQYVDLFKTDPDYAYSASRSTPEQLADKMTASLATGAANKDGKGIRRTCTALGIKYTYAAIREYLK